MKLSLAQGVSRLRRENDSNLWFFRLRPFRGVGDVALAPEGAEREKGILGRFLSPGVNALG